MASRKSTKSRSRRNPANPPRAIASDRREDRARRQAQSEQQRRRAGRQLGREGERPASPFGGLPVSELAILLGLIAAVVGFIRGGGPALVVGLVICALGVMEICAREHFSGYRSHTALLSAIPAVLVEVGLVLALGEPRDRALLLLAVVPVFAGLFWLLRRKFLAARQARVARMARPPAPRTPM